MERGTAVGVADEVGNDVEVVVVTVVEVNVVIGAAVGGTLVVVDLLTLASG